MKTLMNFLYILILVFFIGFSACTPKENDELVAPGSEPSKEIDSGFQAKLNGSEWKANRYKAIITGKRVIIKGYTDSLGYINIALLDTTPGIYYLNETSGHYATFANDSNDYDLYSTFNSPKVGGVVIITDINQDSTFISGNFNFAVYNKKLDRSYTISEGSFIRVGYSTEVTIAYGISAKTKDSLSWTSANGVDGYISDGYIQIVGTGADNSLMHITVYNDTIGSFILNASSAHWADLSQATTKTLYSTKKGSTSGGMVIISRLTRDSLVSGNFVFTVSSENGTLINFTEGYFKDIKLK
jgi:hypothetical protein